MTKINVETSSFGKRLESAREAARLSQNDLAMFLGFRSRASISNMERGKQGIDIKQVEKLAKFLKVSASWLAFGYPESQKQKI